jgi:hypothetical protein
MTDETARLQVPYLDQVTKPVPSSLSPLREWALARVDAFLSLYGDG